MKNPKVTVLMPVYNGAKYLNEAIESILSQKFSDFEFLIMDDGSTDESLEIIKSYNDPRIKLIVHEINKGVVAMLNEGVDLAKGEYIARMDADDISLPSRLGKQVTFMDIHPEIGVCGAWAKAINEDGNVLFLMKAPSGIFLKYNYWKPSPLIHPSVIMRKSALKNMLFDTDAKNAEDYDLWLRMMKKNKIFNMREYLISYRVHDDNISIKNRKEQLESSYRSFLNNTLVKNITFEDFIIATSLETTASPMHRLRIMRKIKKEIEYPIAFMIFDNLVYTWRWISCLNKLR